MARAATPRRAAPSPDERYERLRSVWQDEGLGARMIERCGSTPPLCPACLAAGQERFLGWSPELSAFSCGAKGEAGLPQPHVFCVKEN